MSYEVGVRLLFILVVADPAQNSRLYLTTSDTLRHLLILFYQQLLTIIMVGRETNFRLQFFFLE